MQSVYAIDVIHATPQTDIGRLMALDANIQRLAVRLKADVHMRQPRHPSAFDSILVECDAAFIAEVRKLGDVGSVRELTKSEARATIRRSEAPQIEAPEAIIPQKPRGPKGP